MSISTRERFLGICRFERRGDLCLLTPTINDFWDQTLKDWVKQGAPEQILDSRFRAAYFQFDYMHYLRDGINSSPHREFMEISGGVSYGFLTPPIVPTYEPRLIEENERTVTVITHAGKKARVFKDTPDKMPMFLDYPVKDRNSWEDYKKRLDPDTSERWPSDWNTYVQKANSKTEPAMLHIGGFFGFLREWMGLERLLYMFHDDPNLVEDMMEQVYYVETEIIKRVIKDIKVDCAMFWEDMAFKTGSLISPDMVRKFMMPRYKKVTDILHGSGVDVIFLDSDGNINELIPLWLECGINFHWPLECAAGMDAVALRKKYGRDIILAGNLDKRVLSKGKDAIREEVMSKVPFLLESGGYFPCADHLVPPDATLENYRYFINTLREVAGLEKLPE
ncbi:uroporphyrinogen decarboxylase family protein [Chloroflexota bacterium]